MVSTYYKNQGDLIASLITVIDDYFKNDITESQMFDSIKLIYNNNKDFVIRDGDIAYTIKRRLGKRRMNVLKGVLNVNGKDRY